MATGLAIATGAFLAITPVAINAFMPDGVQPASDTNAALEPETSLVAFTGRNVEIDGSILGFRQSGDTIQVNLMANDYGQRVFLQDINGELLEIPVAPGQTVVNAQVPDYFAPDGTLTVRVD